MSKEISEEELTEKIITLCGELEDIGEKGLSKELFKKLEKKMTFVELPDWVNHQICETFPHVCIKDLVFCCSPKNPCPYRAAVLRKLGLTLQDYTDIKKDLANDIEPILWTYEEGNKRKKGLQ